MATVSANATLMNGWKQTANSWQREKSGPITNCQTETGIAFAEYRGEYRDRFPQPARGMVMAMPESWPMVRDGQGMATMRQSLAQAAAIVGRSRSRRDRADAARPASAMHCR